MGQYDVVGGMWCKLVDCRKEACDAYSEGWQVYYILLPTFTEGVRVATMIDLSREEYAYY
jgi:hypothetical protein